jgi:hypothetical protein
MLPIKRLNTIPSVYISDGQGQRLDLLIPVRGGASVSEQALVEKVVKEHGVGSLNPLMKAIATKTAEKNGGDPIKVLTLLVKYSRGEYEEDPLGDYRSYFITHCEDEFNQFVAATETGILRKWEMAACIHALLSRVPPSEEFSPAKWKTEMALDGKILPLSVLREAANLYYLEAQGQDITPYVNADLEFTFIPDSKLKVMEDKKEREKAEAIAGK